MDSLVKKTIFRLFQNQAFDLDDLEYAGFLPEKHVRHAIDIAGKKRGVVDIHAAALQILLHHDKIPDPQELIDAGIFTSEEYENALDACSTGAFGKYESLVQIGEGQTGKVYSARDRVLSRNVAIKILKAENPDMRARLLIEARAQGRIHHSSVCKVYETGETDGRAFIAMQLIPGTTLKESFHSLRMEEKVKVMIKVAECLHEAHKLGIIHRDMKPGNIMLERLDTGEWVPYVMDFGLAREIDDPGLTQTGTIVGSPSYMAPEQAMADKEGIDRRTDVYACGVSLYEILTGKVPFAGDDLMTVLRKIIDEEPPPPRTDSGKALPKDLETIILKSIEKEPARRYDSAKALAEDLQLFLQGDPVKARPAGIATRSWKKVKKHRKFSAVIALISLVAIVFGAMAVRERLVAKKQTEAAQRFGHQAQAIETLMRLAHMQPLHDIRPEKNSVRARIALIEEEMNRLGRSAIAPGEYALGKGYLSLQENEKAYEHLTKAWEAGNKSSENAYAIGLILSRLYSENLESAERIANPELRAHRMSELQEEFRKPAFRYLSIASAATLDSPIEYVQSLIFLMDKKYDKATEFARKSYERTPWFYEARVLEADTAATAAKELSGPEKLAAFLNAESLYETAAAYAGSNPEVFQKRCALMTATMIYKDEQGADTTQLFESASLECQKALAIDNSDDRSHSENGWLYYNRALTLYRNGGDFESLANQALLYSTGAYQIRKTVQTLNAIGSIHTLQGEALESFGENPAQAYIQASEYFLQSISEDPTYHQSEINYADVCWRLGMYLWDQGEDPTALLQKALASTGKILKEIRSEEILITSGNSNLNLGIYNNEKGIDPVPALESSLKQYQEASQANPKSYLPHSNMSQSLHYLGEHSWLTGKPDKALEYYSRAIKEAQAALKMNPQDADAAAMVAYTHAFQAELKMQQGEDPQADIKKSIEYAGLALEINPEKSHAYAHLGLAYRHMAAWRRGKGEDSNKAADSSIRFIEKAISANPGQYWNYMLLANSYLEKGMGEAARGKPSAASFQAGIRAADTALQINAKADLAFLARAKLLLALAQPTESKPALLDQALADAEKAIELHPNYAGNVIVKAEVLRLQAKRASGESAARLKSSADKVEELARSINPLVELHDHN